MKSYQHSDQNQAVGDKEKVPLHSLKEIKPVSNCSGLYACERSRMREGLLKRTAAALVEDALQLTGGTRGPIQSDALLWANCGWVIGWRRFAICLATARGDIEEKITREYVFESREKVKILQNLLNPWWKRAKKRAPSEKSRSEV